jgi:hypothetical protein
MPAKVLAARISVKDIGIAAYALRMTDASKAEVAKCCILIQAGYDPEDAKREVLAMRNPITELTDDKDVFSIKIPEHWADEAQKRLPDLTPSQMFRYSVFRIAENHREALARATEPKQGWPLGKPRKQEVTA